MIPAHNGAGVLDLFVLNNPSGNARLQSGGRTGPHRSAPLPLGLSMLQGLGGGGRLDEQAANEKLIVSLPDMPPGGVLLPGKPRTAFGFWTANGSRSPLKLFRQ